MLAEFASECASVFAIILGLVILTLIVIYAVNEELRFKKEIELLNAKIENEKKNFTVGNTEDIHDVEENDSI